MPAPGALPFQCMDGLSLSMPPWLLALFYGNWYGINRMHRGGIKDGSASILAVADYGARNWQSIDLEIDGAEIKNSDHITWNPKQLVPRYRRKRCSRRLPCRK